MDLMHRIFSYMMAGICLALAGCEDATGTQQTLAPSLAQMDIISGNGQTAAAGTELSKPIIVKVVDSQGRAVTNQIVNFRVTSGGGMTFAGTTLTNANGVAQERWTLGTQVGAQTVEARAVDSATGGKLVYATFQATAVNPSQLVASVTVSPASLNLSVGSKQQLTATARNASGTAISGKTFSWSSGNTTVATVSNSGLVTARAKGTVQITASVDGRSSKATITVAGGTTPSRVSECATPGAGWIFCDDFEQDRLARYFEYDAQGGAFARAGSTGVDGSVGMRARYGQGQTNAGSLKLAFGRTPNSYFRPADAGTTNYREIYWRVYVRNAPGWTGGGGDKLSRAISFARSDWSEALIAHVWSGSGSSSRNYVVADPASGTNAQGNVVTSGYNDFDNLRWFGAVQSSTPIFDSQHVGQWYCIEARARMNNAGQSNGVFEIWINGQLEARTTNLNWVGSYSAYGINAVFLENLWNNGSPRAQERYFDNFVVSTQRIGCV
jgi:hypothetical protein